MQRLAKISLGVVALAAALAAPRTARSAENEGALPRLPAQVREDCWLRAPPGAPERPCEFLFGAAPNHLQDRAVLVRERAGARRRGVAIQIRGSNVELYGAGRVAGSLGPDLGWVKSLVVLHNHNPHASHDREVLFLSPAPTSSGLSASVLLAPVFDISWFGDAGNTPDGAFAAIGLTDRRRRFVALDLLVEYDLQPVKQWLLPGLGDPDELVRLAVANALSASRVTEAAERIAGWLGPADRPEVSPFTRAQIARALGKLQSPAGLPALEHALADPAFEVREAAVEALGAIGGPAAASLVAGRVEDPEVRVRRAVGATLGKFKDPSLAPAFRKAFADPDQRTRFAAVKGAVPLELRALVPAFIERLHDPDGEVQYQAVLALGKLRAREAAPHLVPLLKARDPRVVRETTCFVPASSWPLNCAAAQALRDIGDAAGLAEAKKLTPHCLAVPQIR